LIVPNDVDLAGGSWRVRPRGAVDPQMKRLGLIAACLAGAAVLGIGGWVVTSARPHLVPVIEADRRPLRIKPDNPGGMQIANSEEQIMGGAGSGNADAMAPLAETPSPQTLRTQAKSNRDTAPAPEPVAQVPVSQPPATAAPVASAPPELHPVRPNVPVAHPAPVVGGVQVQLAALESEQAARSEWQRLSKRMPDLLGDRRPAVQRVERGGRTLFRLRMGGFADVAAAANFCAQVRTKGAGCAIATF